MTDRDRSVPDWATGCQTLDESDFGDAPGRLWLVYVGSAEDAFANAGRCVPLDDIDRVLFGRATHTSLHVERMGADLRIDIPLGGRARVTRSSCCRAKPAERIASATSAAATA